MRWLILVPMWASSLPVAVLLTVVSCDHHWGDLRTFAVFGGLIAYLVVFVMTPLLIVRESLLAVSGPAPEEHDG